MSVPRKGLNRIVTSLGEQAKSVRCMLGVGLGAGMVYPVQAVKAMMALPGRLATITTGIDSYIQG